MKNGRENKSLTEKYNILKEKEKRYRLELLKAENRIKRVREKIEKIKNV